MNTRSIVYAAAGPLAMLWAAVATAQPGDAGPADIHVEGDEPGTAPAEWASQESGQDPAEAIEEIVVVGARSFSPDEALLQRRRWAPGIGDGLSAEQLRRTADSTAADAIKRIVAATVHDGRYLVVRGLGGRYTGVLLNGAPLPSPDPDGSATPLDLFPASLLASLQLQKGYSPDLPGAFAGGVLQLETRDFPRRPTLRIKLSSGGDSTGTWRDAPSAPGGSLADLGFGGESRGLPESIGAEGPLVASESLPQAEIDALGKDFVNQWSAEATRRQPNLGVAVELGDTFTVGSRKLGLASAVGVGHRSGLRRSTARRTDATGRLVTEVRAIDAGVEATTVNASLNAGLTVSSSQRLGLLGLYIRRGDDSAQLTSYTPEGQASSTRVERTSLRFVERALGFAQLSGVHAVPAGGLLTWQANVARTTMDEPDTRDITYLTALGGPQTIAGSGAGSADRFFAALSDTSGGASADLGVPVLTGSEVKVGGAWQRSSRTFSSRRFRFSVTDQSLEGLPPEQIFAPDNLGAGVHLTEVTGFTDGFVAGRNLGAGYALVDLGELEWLRLIAGARYERLAQTIDVGSRYSLVTATQRLGRNDGQVMPSVSVVADLDDELFLRAGYSRTVARPTFRELSPALYYDFARGRTASGNPELRTTRIDNLDLRGEWFLGGSELIAVGAFYKHLDQPIEAAFKDQNGDAMTYVNTPRARCLGAEVEARLELSRLAAWLTPFFVGGNLSLIHSRIDLDGGGGPAVIEGTRRRRPLQGQSPVVVNVELGARLERTETELTALYNLAGARIAEVGVGGTPDAYEAPLHRLDLTISQELGDYRLKIAGTNLLNQRAQFVREDTVILGYAPGVAVHVALEWAYN